MKKKKTSENIKESEDRKCRLKWKCTRDNQ